MNKEKCKCCERESSSLNDLRLGICFDCATAESIISEGVDMYDKPIPKLEKYSPEMAKVKAILNLFKRK